MQSIKIKVWNKSRKGFFGTANVEIRDSVLTCNDDEVILLNTGLKDKNGKEIYEGDIRCGKYYFETEEQTRFQVIKWDEKNACFYWDGPEIPGFIDVEVIGNIYENPELLK